ncbi:MAG: glycosyltransferase family 9 protein [Planctomycetota bacterium]
MARKPKRTPERILVVRNDKLGDFVLALPTFALLKRALPASRLTALVPEYTREIAEMSPDIDDVVIDPGADAGVDALADALRPHDFEAAIALWTTARTGRSTRRAGIPWRSAPASKLPALLFNHPVVQRRSKVTKPEYAYNRDMARHFLAAHGVPAEFPLERPVLPVDSERAAERRADIERAHGFPSSSPLVLVHSGSGGSANNLTIEQYSRLLRALDPERELSFLLTAGPGEEQQATALAENIDGLRCGVHASREGLAAFVDVVATADLFIGGSTGPMHIAGALNRPTLAFYPRRRTSSPLRWQTLNDESRRLAFAPPEPAHERDMSALDLDAIALEARAFFEGLTGSG